MSICPALVAEREERSVGIERERETDGERDGGGSGEKEKECRSGDRGRELRGREGKGREVWRQVLYHNIPPAVMRQGGGERL